MPVYKSKEATKSGRSYYFKVNYEDYYNKDNKMVSKKFDTMAEAKQAELEFLILSEKLKKIPTKMTFGELYEKFLDHKRKTVKYSTFHSYNNSISYFKEFMKVKCVNYNIEQFEVWRKKMMKKKHLSTKSKNKLLKFWKSILNYGTDWYGFNFSSVYRKMELFKNPDELKKEMHYYTYDEFKKFISHEDDFMYRCLWQVFYFCGLRHGEARGLLWNNIDFEKKTLSVTKQVIKAPPDRDEEFLLVPPKTKTSYRTIPLKDNLFNDLKKLKDIEKNKPDFSESNFIFYDTDPSIPKNTYLTLARRTYLAKKAKLKIIRIHDFRHSCASLLINSGANVTVVAKYLGHSEIEETLNTYSHMFPHALNDVINIINNVNSR